MIVTRQIDTQPWRWEIQGSGKTSYVALEGDEIVVGDQWGDKERTYRCDLESFVDGSFHAVILDTFDKKVLSTHNLCNFHEVIIHDSCHFIRGNSIFSPN